MVMRITDLIIFGIILFLKSTEGGVQPILSKRLRAQIGLNVLGQFLQIFFGQTVGFLVVCDFFLGQGGGLMREQIFSFVGQILLQLLHTGDLFLVFLEFVQEFGVAMLGAQLAFESVGLGDLDIDAVAFDLVLGLVVYRLVSIAPHGIFFLVGSAVCLKELPKLFIRFGAAQFSIFFDQIGLPVANYSAGFFVQNAKGIIAGTAFMELKLRGFALLHIADQTV